MNPAMLQELADFFKTLGDPVRLGLMLRLKDRELTVSDLASSSDTSVANVSKHLALMRKAGLLERRKRGNQVYYTIRNRNVFEICDTICGSIREGLAARHAGVAGLPDSADVPADK
jgi:ArsR family transcriptional regulator